MCLLTFLPAGVLPDPAALLNGAAINDDGHGYAIVVDDHILVRHGMLAEDMVETFDTIRREHPDGPALFHSRFATHGEPTLDNCHPYLVGGDARTVLAHNGVLPAIVQPATGDPRSDTRIAAEDFLPTFGSLTLRRTRLQVERWMTRHNKMVILTVDRRFKQRAYILNETSGIWDGDIWYSNDGYLPPPPRQRWRRPARRPWPLWDRLEPTSNQCGLCGAVIDLTRAQCPYCCWCLDCGEMPEDCSCWPPAVPGRRIGRQPTR